MQEVANVSLSISLSYYAEYDRYGRFELKLFVFFIYRLRQCSITEPKLFQSFDRKILFKGCKEVKADGTYMLP